MPETVRAQVTVRVAGGPSLGAAVSRSVAAYDKVSVTVPAFDADTSTAGEITVDLQPSDADHLELLMITATRYHESDLHYELGSLTINLDGPQLFSGSGMIGLFDSAPETMAITNELDTPVTVSVLVARNTS